MFAGGVNGGEETAYAESETRNATAGIYGGYAMGGGLVRVGTGRLDADPVSNRRRLDGSAAKPGRITRTGFLSLQAEVSRDVSLGDGGGWNRTRVRGRPLAAGVVPQRPFRAQSVARGSARVSGDAPRSSFGLPDGSTWTRGWRWSRNSALADGSSGAGGGVDHPVGRRRVDAVLGRRDRRPDRDTATGHLGLNLVGNGGLTFYVDYTPLAFRRTPRARL